VGDLAQARSFALSLPGTSEEPHFDMTSFRVNGRIFATGAADESCLHIFVDESEVAASAAEEGGADAPHAVEPLVWGRRVRGLRVVLAHAPDERVRELLALAWRRKAGRRLAADFDAANREV
jgi:hypothetical protein